MVADQILELVIGVTREIASTQDMELPETIAAGTRLYGQGGLLDSMALVSLIVALEQAIDEKYGVAVALADEKALSLRESPYRTVSSLAGYVTQELAARGRNV